MSRVGRGRARTAAAIWMASFGFASACGDGTPLGPPGTPGPVFEVMHPTAVPVSDTAVILEIYGRHIRIPYAVYLADMPLETALHEGILLARVPPGALRTGARRTVQVRVTPNQYASFELSIRNPRPAVESVSPAVVPVGLSATFTVEGRDFVPGAKVWLGEREYLATLVDGNTLVIDVAGSELRTPLSLPLRVENPGPGGGSSPVGATVRLVTRPLILGAFPSWAPVGSGEQPLTVHGEGFTPASVVEVNGTDVETTFIDASRLSVTLPASATASNGGVSYRVRTRDFEASSLPAWLPVIPTSQTVTESVQVEMDAHQILSDRARSVLYVSLVGTEGRIVALDPLTQATTPVVEVGGEVGRMALSDDGRYLYATVQQAARAVRIDVEARAIDLEIPLSAPATDLAVVPGDAARSLFALNNHSVLLFRDAEPLDSVPGGPHIAVAPSEVSGSTTAYLGGGNSYAVVEITGNMLAMRATGGSELAGRLHATAGYVFGEGHRGGLPATRHDPGALLRRARASIGGPMTLDPERGRLHMISGDGHERGRLHTLHLHSLEPLGSVALPWEWDTRSVALWGTDGLAVAIPRSVVLLNTSLIGG